MNAKRWRRSQVEAVIMLYLSGWTLSTIAAIVGVSYGEMWQLVNHQAFIAATRDQVKRHEP